MIRKGVIITNLFAIICCIKFILIDLTTFDLSYTVYNRERDIQTNTYILYCKNDLGNFKIDVNEKTYNNKPYGSIVRYDKPFSSYEMYMFATDRETEQNVLKSLSSTIERITVTIPILVPLSFVIILVCSCFTVTNFIELFSNG